MLPDFKKDEVILFNLNGDLTLARVEEISFAAFKVRDLVNVFIAPQPTGEMRVMLRPYLPVMVGLIKDGKDAVFNINPTTVPIVHRQNDIDPDLVASFLSSVTGIAVPAGNSLVDPSGRPMRATKAAPNDLPTGRDLNTILGQASNDDDGDDE